MNPDFAEFVGIFITAHVVVLLNNYYINNNFSSVRRISTIIFIVPISYTVFYAGYLILLTNSEFVFDKTRGLLMWVISGLSWKFLETIYENFTSNRSKV